MGSTDTLPVVQSMELKPSQPQIGMTLWGHELWRKDSCQDGAEARSTECWGGIKVLDKAGRSGVREETGAEGNGASQANRRLVKL